jgi:hypothetical protein
MPHPSPVELKRALIGAGFEIYRTLGDRVVLADRVRDNLIMDSGVAAGTGETLRVRVVLRAQASEFPGAAPEELLERARSLASSFDGRGYTEVDTQTIAVKDPGNPDRTIDTWYEVSWERSVDGMEALVSELRYALSQQKSAIRA